MLVPGKHCAFLAIYRSEVKTAVAACQAAGIKVGMVTGDHPTTAFAIGAELGLVKDPVHVVSGPELKKATNDAELDACAGRAKVFARVEPQQKLDIVTSL